MDHPTESAAPSGSAQPHGESSSKKKPTARQRKKSRWLLSGTGKVLANIPSSQLTPSDVAVTSSGGYDLVCAYSWVKESSPTVYVPGDPPRFISTQVPFSIPRDSKEHFTDRGTFQLPKYTFEVVFRAMEVMNPDYRFDDVDVLIDRNSLRKLLDFVRGNYSNMFRINMFIVHNTLVVEMWEAMTKMISQGSQNTGWGHNFEKAITRPGPGMEDHAEHGRVLRYDFGGLRCAVRFEVDASYGDSGAEAPGEGQSSPGNTVMEANDLSEALGTLKIQEPPTDPKVKGLSQIRVISRGSGIPHIAAAEIKSMKCLKSPGLMMPQLWFGRTQNLIRGVHSEGVFHNIQISSVEEDLRRWEAEDQNQIPLRKVAALLSQLRDIVKKSKQRACVAVYEKSPNPVLQVFAATHRKTSLPQDICKKFWKKK
ncbi:hypothetical protein EDB80DRAFT_703938 [Ilyonectria destructans]|nr:hypothetical protein EDB80DRAFT_703938 [Ilyonectria destructans]